MASGISTDELLKKLDEQHQAYLQTFRLVHEALTQNLQASSSAPAPTSPTSPISNSLAPPTITLPPISISRSPSTSRRPRRSTLDIDADGPLRRTNTYHSSVFTGDSDESEYEGELYVQEPLPSYTYDVEDLRQHLKRYNFGLAGKLLLKSVVRNGKLSNPALFGNYPSDEKWHNSHYSVFDVGQDGAPLSRWEVVKPGTVSIDSAIWQAIQDLNVNPEARVASGRITIVREPSPLIFGALHLAMNRDFDMDEIFSLLVEEDHSCSHMTNRAFKHDQRRQRTFIFNFDYFTVVGDGIEPMPWQRTDRPEKLLKKFDGHIRISRCSSVVALSLSGAPIKKLKNTSRHTKTESGFAYDPWAPWHILNIQCYPDHKHSMDSHDSTKHYLNGPEAFLHTVLTELKDAEKRFREINVRITKLITPEADFMFDGNLRDKLLFEDHNFTYSRRYFWAYQTLGIMMNAIKDILDAYDHVFTSEVWEGKHRTLWPLMEDYSERNIYWRKRLASLKRDFDKQIKNLIKLHDENDNRRKEIRTLRDQLFSGTSVLESRKSVELSEVTILQGHNIKLLTLVSIFFLPLTFVTSVFGMSNMPTENEFGVFGIVMATVCVPFFLLIGSLNTTQGMRFWRSKWHQVLAWTMGKKYRDGNEEDSDYDDKNTRPETLKKQKRSLSTSLAIQKRQEQVKSLKQAAILDENSEVKENGQTVPLSTSSQQQELSNPLEAILKDSTVSFPELDLESNTTTGRKTAPSIIATPESAAKTTSARSRTTSKPSWWEKSMSMRRQKKDLMRDEHVV